jgi:phospholipid/cholesterol/gamma-HCH transport system substrate-binding protein
MKRLLSLILLLAALTGIVVLGSGAGDSSSSDGYQVRAIFDDAFSVIPGEDVKIAGVKVGKIKSLDVTETQQAAIVLEITEPGFADFRKDATCTIRPQSLIGEKFVECTPTEPRSTGAQPAPPLEKIESGKGEGQYLLPASQTSRPVDIDLVNNVLRLPYRQRLSILLNEFGTALAGRGGDLRQIIRKANPGLRETDRVLKILASQDQVLADLARDSDKALAPITRERGKVASFITKAGDVNTAVAERRADFERNLELLPDLLAQLRPTMQELGNLSDQASPVLADLGAVAPSVNGLIAQLGPFSQSATQSLTTLGAASVPGRTALVKSRPIIKDLAKFASTSRPLSQNLKEILESLRDTGGIERVMDYIFFQVAAINGYDSTGHYLRAQLLVNTCSIFAIETDPSCTANFAAPAESRSATARAALNSQDQGRSPALARSEAILRGMSPEDALAGPEQPAGKTAPAAAPLRLPSQVLPGGAEAQGTAPAASKKPASGPAPAPDGVQSGDASLLDYLLGGS